MLLSETVEHRRRFAPGWPLWVFTLSLLPLLLGLGTWQLQRAEQKQQLQADIDALAQAPAKTLAQLGTQPPADWQPLSLQGQLDPHHIWLLDNRTRNGQAGVEVLQAFQADNGDWLVLNRGWLPWPDRRQPPRISTPPGRLQLQAEKLPASSAGWRPGRRACDADQLSCVVAQLDLDALRAQSALPLLNWSARLTNIGSAALTLDWPALPMSASRHTGYAVQWFSLAAALLALFLWAGFRPQQHVDLGGITMMSLTESEQRPSRPRGQLKLLAIIAVVVGPIALAALMAQLDIGMPEGHANKSALVEPAIQTSDWQLAEDPVGYGAPWRLLVTHTGACERQCMALVHEARQINVAVGREAERVTHVLASPVALRADEVAALEAQFPRLERTTFDSNAYLKSLQTQPDSWLIGPQLWLVDPLGRVVLHHSANQPGKDLLDDLKRLLKLSKVG